MRQMPFKQKISFLYLVSVPLLAAIIGFGLAPISPGIYLPIWVVNALVMMRTVWIIGAHHIKDDDGGKRRFVIVACLLIVPWLFFTVFAGMGPPPATAAGWAAKATEQQVRYSILIVGGILASFGFASLREKLQKTAGNFYSRLGFTAIIIAIPLFIINMVFWGSFLVASFKIFAADPSAKRPELYGPIKELFYAISIVEVALIYFATAAFAVALKSAGLFRSAACYTYITISLLGILLCLLPPSLPEPFSTIGYLVSVPAIPFIMPYLIGLNLLRRMDD